MKLLNDIKTAVKSIEPDAEIFLFGSRARGDFKTDSDWDLLILLDGSIDYHRKGKIIEVLLDIEINYVITLNRIVINKKQWYSDRILHATPFYQNVYKEALAL